MKAVKCDHYNDRLHVNTIDKVNTTTLEKIQIRDMNIVQVISISQGVVITGLKLGLNLNRNYNAHACWSYLVKFFLDINS